MKVLHFITSIDSADIYPTEYMSALLRCMGAREEVHLATFRSPGAITVEQVETHLFDYPKRLTDKSFEHNFSEMLSHTCPEIIHLHGCWDRTLWTVASQAREHDIPLILSPHGALEPAVMRAFFLTRRLPRLVAYQYRTALAADVLLSSTQEEEDNLSDMLWNRHIAVIPDPRLSPTTDYDEVCTRLLSLYRKTIDTKCCYHTLNTEEQDAVKSLLLEGTAHDGELLHTTQQQKENLLQLTDKSWRKLFIIAHNHSLNGLYANAFLRLGLTPPSIDVSHIERFDRAEQAPATLPADHLLYANPLQKSKLAAISDNQVRQLATLLLNTRHLIRQGDIHLNHLSKLYTQFRYEDYDEDLFAESMNTLRLKKFTRQVEQLLAQLFGLTEGFMPIPACTEAQANTLIAQTIKAL